MFVEVSVNSSKLLLFVFVCVFLLLFPGLAEGSDATASWLRSCNPERNKYLKNGKYNKISPYVQHQYGFV